MIDLIADPKRATAPDTGIYVRGKDLDGQWGSYDIAELTPESLLIWLRRDGGNNPLAENVVGILLGRGNITESKL